MFVCVSGKRSVRRAKKYWKAKSADVSVCVLRRRIQREAVHGGHIYCVCLCVCVCVCEPVCRCVSVAVAAAAASIIKANLIRPQIPFRRF